MENKIIENKEPLNLSEKKVEKKKRIQTEK
jgi:hypothetical protein